MTEYLTPKQAADALKVDRQTIYRWVKEGRLEAERLGERGLRISPDALKAVVRPVKP